MSWQLCIGHNWQAFSCRGPQGRRTWTPLCQSQLLSASFERDENNPPYAKTSTNESSTWHLCSNVFKKEQQPLGQETLEETWGDLWGDGGGGGSGGDTWKGETQSWREALHPVAGTPWRELWPMEDLCQSRGIPGWTMAHGGPTVKQKNSKSQGAVEES